MYPCDALAQRYLEVCYQYQSSYFAQLTQYDWQKNAKLCQQVPILYQRGCFNIIGSNQVGSTQDYAKMQTACNLMPNINDVKICLLGVVDGLSGRYVGQVAKVSDFCLLLNSDVQKICYENLGRNILGWTSDHDKFASDCAELKKSKYVQWCLSGGSFNPNSQTFN